MTSHDNYLTLDDMSVIRSAGLRGFREVVRELGGDPVDLARRARLDPAALGADDVLVPDLAMAAVLELAAHDLACPDLGLRVAARQDLSLLGPLALAIENSPTVAAALECTERYLFVHAPAMSIRLVPDPEGADGVSALEYQVAEPGTPVPRQGVDLSLGSLHRAVGSLVGGHYGLRTVDLPGRPLAPLAAYEAFFGVSVRFGRPVPTLRLPADLGRLPLAGRDEAVRRLALGFLAQQVPADERTRWSSRVRGALVQLLGTGAPDLGVVARLLDVHPRTLQRRLAEEGAGFAEVLDDVRRTEAERYLTTTDAPMGQIAGLLGLSEQSALTRACRRWFNASPREVRRLGRGGKLAP